MLFYKDDICIFFGTLNPVPHSHHALEISIGSGSPLKLYMGEQKSVEVEACIILPDQRHRITIDPGKGEKITLMVDADLPQIRAVTNHYRTRKEFFVPVSMERIAPFITQILQAKNTAVNNNGASLFKLLKEMLDFLFPDYVAHPMNAQALHMTQHVKQNITKNKFLFKELSKELSRSESRLSHLFKEETGISFRKYVLWTRLKTAVEAYQNGNSITQASYISGFADSSHFHKVYTDMFGLKPSLPLKEYTKAPGGIKKKVRLTE